MQNNRRGLPVWRLQKIQLNYHQGCIPPQDIDEALQAANQSNWFTSFDLAQRYLQLAMAEEDAKKTAFRVGSSGLYEYIRLISWRTGLCARRAKELHSFLGPASYYMDFIPNFASLAQCLYDLVSPISTKKRNSKKTNSPSTLTNSEVKPQIWPLCCAIIELTPIGLKQPLVASQSQSGKLDMLS